MNKFKIIVSAAFLAAMTISCEDFTDIDRGFILTQDGSINTAEDLERLMLGSYNANNSYAGIISINSLATDEARIGLGNRGQGLQSHSFNLVTGSGEPTGVYNGLYDVIDNVNRVIAQTTTIIAEDDADAALLEQLRGEALAVRAWQYFDLLRMFAPEFDNPNGPGVPLVTEVLQVGISGFAFPRNTVGEVLAQINADFDEALGLLQASNPGNLNRMTPDAIEAFQARLALYTNTDASLQLAISKATSVINNRSLASGTDYVNVFRQGPASPPANGEVIFQIERDQFDNRIGTIWSDVNQDVFFSVSTDLNSLFTLGDDRRTVNVDRETTITTRATAANPAGSADIFVGKYLGSPTLISLDNVKVLRVSEMLLIRAEAQARLGNLQPASDDIFNLRQVRGSSLDTPDPYASVDEALEDILLERRIELAFEGHRMLDLKRFGEVFSRPALDCQGAGAGAGDRAGTTCDFLLTNFFRYTFPIPQAEIFANDGITDADQNPGY